MQLESKHCEIKNNSESPTNIVLFCLFGRNIAPKCLNFNIVSHETHKGWMILPPHAGWLQSCDGLLPVLYNGQLLLATGGRPLSSRAAGRLLLLREEVLLGLHPDWLG